MAGQYLSAGKTKLTFTLNNFGAFNPLKQQLRAILNIHQPCQLRAAALIIKHRKTEGRDPRQTN